MEVSFEGLKARVGLGGRHRKYVDIESVRDLEDISDPETTENESGTGLREWADNHPVLSVIVLGFGVIIVGVMLFWMRRVVPGVLTNPIVWKGAIVTIFCVVSYRFGWVQHDRRVSDWDELQLSMGGKLVSYKGIYLDDFPGEADGFIPIKGWEKGGHKAVPYKNGDLGAAMVENFNPYEMSDSSAAVIRLKPAETEVTHPDWGTRVVQETSGLKPDPNGNNTTLVAELPEYDDDTMDELARQNEQLAEDYYDALGEVEGLKRRVANLKDRLNEPINEEVQQRISEFQQLSDSIHGSRRRQQQPVSPQPTGDFQGNGSMNGHKDEIKDVEEELTNDDD